MSDGSLIKENEIYLNFIIFIAKHNYLPYMKWETVMLLLFSVNIYRLKCCYTIRTHYYWGVFFSSAVKAFSESELWIVANLAVHYWLIIMVVNYIAQSSFAHFSFS